MSVDSREKARLIVAETERQFGIPFRAERRAALEEVIAEAIEDGITWTCHVCGDTRPDRMVRVYKEEYGEDPGAVLTICVRYCADRPECGEAAARETADRWARRFLLDSDIDRAES